MVLLLATTEATARPAARVLLLQSLDGMPLTYGAFADSLRAELNRKAPGPVNFMQLSLQPTGFRDLPETATLGYLRNAFDRGERPDLIVTIGAPAAMFIERHSHELFRDIPVLLAATDQRFLTATTTSPVVARLAVMNDISRVLGNILQVRPRTKDLFVVVGTSPFERAWRDAITRELAKLRPALRVSTSSGMTFDEMLQHSSQLPSDSAILLVLFNIDSHGAAFSEDRVIDRLHQAANAPIFGLMQTQLGKGIVGGPLMAIDEVGRHAGEIAARVLRGEATAIASPVVQQYSAPAFDWRELRRWGIDEPLLPSGSAVLFRTPSFWQRNRRVIAAAAGIFSFETVLIVTLVANWVRSERAQQQLRESEQRFRLLASAAPVMIWMSGTDKKCTDFNRPWLEFTGRTLEEELGDGWTEGVHPEDLSDCVNAYSEAFDARRTFRLEYRLRRADGEYRWVLDSGVPRFLPDGSFAGYIGSAVDITEQRTAQATMSAISGRLLEAQEHERKRIARELHDDISQRLALLTMGIEQMGSGAVCSDELIRQSTQIGQDLQSLSHTLHSSKLEYLGLASAAAAFCREAAAQHGVSIAFTQENMPDDLNADQALALFRVLQEAIANAIRHSGARTIDVALRGRPDGVQLEVIDAGCGFNVATAVHGPGLGLISMEERMKLVEGDLQLHSSTAGTIVRAFAPASRDRSVGNRVHVMLQEL